MDIFKIALLLWGSLVLPTFADDQALFYKGQKGSRLSFENVNTDEFLSGKKWIEIQELKDQSPDWENILRDRSNQEMAGRVLHCVGLCKIDKGNQFTRPVYRSTVYEGEEVLTGKDSYLWLFLFDGTMIRLSPESSVTIVEFNITETGFFVFARVNYGSVLYMSRKKEKVVESNLKETDVSFFPLPLFEAMPERQKKEINDENLIDYLSENLSMLTHRKNLNQKIGENNEWIKNKETYSLVVFPAGTVQGNDVQLEVITHFGNETYLKALDQESSEFEATDFKPLTLTLRGIESAANINLERGVWKTINSRGREFGDLIENSRQKSAEFVIKRIPTILFARELLLEKYSKDFFNERLDRTKLAKEYGYRVWNGLTNINIEEEAGENFTETDKRLRFLNEYTRRIETSNLLVGEKFKQMLEDRGEKVDLKNFTDRYFAEALRKYLIYEVPDAGDPDRFDRNSTEKILWKKKYGIK